MLFFCCNYWRFEFSEQVRYHLSVESKLFENDLSHSAVIDRFCKRGLSEKFGPAPKKLPSRTEVNNLKHFEDILACVLLIFKLCSAALPLISKIQSLVRKHKNEEAHNEKKAISTGNTDVT